MRRLVISVAFAGLLVVMLATVVEPAVQAYGPVSVIATTDCGILLPGILPEGQALITTGTIIVTPGGTATMTCRGQIDYHPISTLIFTDIDCALGEGGQVAESRTVIRPTGQVTLTCQNNPGSEPFVPGDGD